MHESAVEGRAPLEVLPTPYARATVTEMRLYDLRVTVERIGEQALRIEDLTRRASSGLASARTMSQWPSFGGFGRNPLRHELKEGL